MELHSVEKKVTHFVNKSCEQTTFLFWLTFQKHENRLQ